MAALISCNPLVKDDVIYVEVLKKELQINEGEVPIITRSDLRVFVNENETQDYVIDQSPDGENVQFSVKSKNDYGKAVISETMAVPYIILKIDVEIEDPELLISADYFNAFGETVHFSNMRDLETAMRDDAAYVEDDPKFSLYEASTPPRQWLIDKNLSEPMVIIFVETLTKARPEIQLEIALEINFDEDN